MGKAESSSHNVHNHQVHALKNEGASGDVYENTGTTKNGCQVPTVRHPGRAAGVRASAWTWAAGMSNAGSGGHYVRKAEMRELKYEGASGDIYENKATGEKRMSGSHRPPRRRGAGVRASAWTRAAGMSNAGSGGHYVRKAEMRELKYEGASGDIYENKETGETACATTWQCLGFGTSNTGAIDVHS